MSAASDPLPAPGAPQAPPEHVAIIMDGNRRWAEARGVPIALGHRAGAEAARRAVEAAAQAGIGWMTLFAFSSENWRRPTEEVSALSGLLRLYLRNEVAGLIRDGVKLTVIGDHSRFGADLSAMVADAEKATAGGTRLNLVMALSYGARDEILAATRAVARAAKAGRLDPESLTEVQFGGFLQTAGMPDPDLIIRTSGEQRLSNFLLWQAAYAEFVFLDVLWPDFSAEDLQGAVGEYHRRERRYGLRA
ncbi:MAG: di-trans,poly-cis-decaprenylcistransferase [Roseomonas sp.]|jgi:undecaprenyl diphosphate synthase|nr:di-trans,poly-cis-decaprenylcistransferase [Roseomonas sp.]